MTSKQKASKKSKVFRINDAELKRMALIVAARPELQLMGVNAVTHQALKEWTEAQAEKLNIKPAVLKIEMREKGFEPLLTAEVLSELDFEDISLQACNYDPGLRIFMLAHRNKVRQLS